MSLADVASSAGLTRMHFALQFRAATGLRPHEYLLRRRIERAQEMLVGTSMSLVDVALSVGFHRGTATARVVRVPRRFELRAPAIGLAFTLLRRLLNQGRDLFWMRLIDRMASPIDFDRVAVGSLA